MTTRQNPRRNTCRKSLFAIAGLCVALHAQADGTLTFGPMPAMLAPGDSFEVAVRGAGFDEHVVGGGFELWFDPQLLALDNVQVDTSVWEFLSSPGQIDNGNGRLSDVYFNSFAAQLPTGDFAVATLHFTAQAPGAGMLQLAGSPSFPFASDQAELITVDFGAAAPTVSAVPEPAVPALWAAGLGVLGWRRWRARPGAGSA